MADFGQPLPRQVLLFLSSMFTRRVILLFARCARQGEKASKEAALIKTYTGNLNFPDMTNSDVDNGRFDTDVRWNENRLSSRIHLVAHISTNDVDILGIEGRNRWFPIRPSLHGFQTRNPPFKISTFRLPHAFALYSSSLTSRELYFSNSHSLS